MVSKYEAQPQACTDPKPLSKEVVVKASTRKGHYTDDGDYIDENGIELCEWCDSKRIKEIGSNGFCLDCGSHW